MKAITFTFIALTSLAIATVCFALFFQTLAGTALYDHNFAIFKYTLSPDQGTAIIATSKSHLILLTFLLASTNLFWILFALSAIVRLSSERNKADTCR